VPLLISTLWLGACGGEAPAGSLLPGVTPVASSTPDPHMTEPASVDEVIRKLAIAGLRITPNNATSGRDGEPVKSVNATFEGWPLSISQYTSAEALKTKSTFDPEKGPAGGDATYIIAGLNILIEYGPDIHTKSDPPPETRYRTSAMKLVEYLHPLLGPLQQVTVDPLPLPGTAADAQPAAASASTAP
jgi:hypothetical protein